MSASVDVAPPDVIRIDTVDRPELERFLGRFGLMLAWVADGAPIPGSFWGDSEAGLVGSNLYVRADTPLHSALHEACHFICMAADRRESLHTDARSDDAEENAVCYLQILIADLLKGQDRARMCRDMDAWGYTFRLGSAVAWFARDAEDARRWLIAHGVIDEQSQLIDAPADAQPTSRRGVLVALASLAATACSRAGFWAVNLPATFGSYTRHADLPFGGDPRQRLDVYVPNPPAAAHGARPVVIFWYGGRWQSGDKGDYRFVADALTALGYVVVLPNYRLYPQVKLAGLMQDAAAAAHWVTREIARYGGDARRLYLMGHSAGAHIATLLALDRRYLEAPGSDAPGGEALRREQPPAGEQPLIAGVIGLSGPYDFLPLTDADLQDLFGPPAAYPDSQPIHFARADAPPMLLVHGTADGMVWPKNSINLAAALRAAGAQATLKLYPDVQHADTVAALSRPVRGRAPTLRDIAAFLPPADA